MIIGLLAACQSKKDSTEKVILLSDIEVIGKYEIIGFNSGVSIDLQRNGEFIFVLRPTF